MNRSWIPSSSVIAWLLLWMSTPLVAAPVASDSSAIGVESLRIEHPETFWQSNGFAEMVPSIRLPTTHDETDMIRVFLFIPEGKKLSSRYLDAQARPTLVFPPGTRADRVELLRYKDDSGRWDETVMDVRGTELSADGTQRFHVFRATGGEPHAPLKGWSWPAGDAVARQTATNALIEMAGKSGMPVNRPPLTHGGLRALHRLNNCSSCHIPNHERSTTTATAPLPRRATDQAGFYTPLSVLLDEVPIAATRPLDLNAGDPYVSVQCGLRPAHLVKEDDWIWFRCDGDGIPIGSRDVVAGLRANDNYTRKVCEARRYLYEHMDTSAREAFAASFDVCGITRR